MLKCKVTKKELTENYYNIISIGYCTAEYLSKYKRTKEKTKEVLKYSTNLIQTYDEILKERYDIEA